jgi:hypothetical protein
MRPRLIAVIAAGVGCLALPAGAEAASITVNTLSDNPSAQCTLRDAVASANANSNQGNCTASGSYGTETVRFSVTGEIQLAGPAGGQLEISSPMTIQGPGQASLTVKGDAGFRVFDVTAGSSTISDLTISGGRPSSEFQSGFETTAGGGIRNAAVLSVNRVTLTDNKAQISVTGGGSDFIEGAGGAIANLDNAKLVVRRSLIEANEAAASSTNPSTVGVPLAFGGGIANGIDPSGYDNPDLTLENSVVKDNIAIAGFSCACQGGSAEGTGGGVSVNAGKVTVARTTLLGNQAEASGAGASQFNGASADGGGLFGRGGGEIAVDQSLIAGGKALADASGVSPTASAVGGGLGSFSATTLTLSRSTVNDNFGSSTPPFPNDGGGGLGTNGKLTVTGTTLTDNVHVNGANLFVFGGSPLVRDTIIALPHGGANCLGDPNSGGYNLEDADSCAFDQPSDQINTDPQLGALAPNGGPTQTRAPLTGSPAIDMGRAFGLASDQRASGFPRPVDFLALPNAAGGDGADIGSYERQGPRCTGVRSTIVGAPGMAISGTSRSDVIYGTGRGDLISGRSGNDLICGRGGNDRIFGGRGRDELHCDGGWDASRGGPGRDHHYSCERRIDDD